MLIAAACRRQENVWAIESRSWTISSCEDSDSWFATRVIQPFIRHVLQVVEPEPSQSVLVGDDQDGDLAALDVVHHREQLIRYLLELR
jgi:hypothetical protein